MRAASLPMYDLPEIRAATAAFWASLATNLRRHGLADVPDKLVHERPVCDLWSDPGLLISQCCGADVIYSYKNRLLPIATPEFAAPGCLGGSYCSMVVVADDCRFDDVRDMQGAVAVINGSESHSGMSSLRHLVSGHHVDGQFFSDVKVSGSHLASLEMIRQREADVAAIDCVTHALLALHRPSALEGTRILATTEGASAPPFVSAAHASKERVHELRSCLFETLRAPETRAARDALLLEGAEAVSEDTFSRIREMCDEADALGYFEVPTFGGRQVTRARP